MAILNLLVGPECWVWLVGMGPFSKPLWGKGLDTVLVIPASYDHELLPVSVFRNLFHTAESRG